LYRDLRSFDALTIILDDAILSPSIFGVDGANAIVALTCVVDDLSLDELLSAIGRAVVEGRKPPLLRRKQEKDAA
jgi:hypothetical protein